ncbi:hypothetical protein HHI36_015647 [Cryptolaemus montrouzieri]|uniref:Protein kinase domain-containing protein n=1 Tax=Cryptolaemus montrouzieri TaxID=559131 RepID=A0ABD2N669_9CUCU
MDKERNSEKMGDVIAGEYEVCHERLIGHGAFAVVYKGRKIKDKNFLVAIKSITKKNLNKCQALLSKEIKILKQLTELHNENLVCMFTCQETPTHVFVVMEKNKTYAYKVILHQLTYYKIIGIYKIK